MIKQRDKCSLHEIKKIITLLKGIFEWLNGLEYDLLDSLIGNINNTLLLSGCQGSGMIIERLQKYGFNLLLFSKDI